MPDLPSVPGADTYGTPDLAGFAQGTKGQYLNFGAGTRTILHGWERVMTAPEGVAEARIDRQPSGPLTITVVSQLDGREVARNQVRYTADAWRERGF
jgi:hypothetical protein